ncbi:Putative ribonuclease H protein At1g65750 [Linum perenne]
MCDIASQNSTAWILAGDFNAMTQPSEKMGGAGFNGVQPREFRECISQCSLIDLGYSRPKFTWYRRNLKERLDQCCCSPEWCDLFPDSTVYHLERIKSDHRPILIQVCNNARFNRAPRPFRFNAAWLSHNDFPCFLDQSWKRGRGVSFALQDFQGSCLRWNKEVFGNIFQRKRFLQNRLKAEGGLGLRKARELNRAYLMKLGWKILKEPESLWVRIMTTKYLKETANGFQLRRKTGGSSLWRGIRSVWHEMAEASQCSINNGKSTSFWKARWPDSGVRLFEHATRRLGEAELEMTVADAVDPAGSWDWAFLHNSLPSRLVQQIVGHDRLLTNAERCRRHFASNPHCDRCTDKVEDTVHILRDCYLARGVWEALIPPGLRDRFFAANLADWLRLGLQE